MNITRTLDRGNFFCPTCEVTQMYRLRTRRPFLTLYFIPTIPVGAGEAFVQCDQCSSSWDPTVLQMSEESHQESIEQRFGDEALRASVLIVLADGQITEAEIEALLRIAARCLDRPVDREELGRICSIAQQNQIEAANYVLTVSRRWDQDQRVAALQAMFLAATADDGLGDSQMRILAEMREILDLTDYEYEQAIESALEWASVVD